MFFRAMATTALVAAATPGPALTPWIDSLSSQGFVVQEGEFGYMAMDWCKTADTCFAMNPLAPYGDTWLPPHPQEKSTEVEWEFSCEKHKSCKGNATNPWQSQWRVARGETVVLVGKAPPKSVYWSFAPSMFSRYLEAPFVPKINWQHPDNTVNSCFGLLHGTRCEVFASVNDPVNHLVSNFSDGEPFDQDFTLVLAWDAVAEQKAITELRDAGAQNVNVMRFPGAVGHLGVTTGKEDEWMALLRVEGIENASAAEEYFASAPFRAFRVTPPSSFGVPDEALFQSFEGRMRPRVTGAGEGASDASFDTLRTALDKLHDAVVQREEERWSGRKRHVASAEFQTFVNDSGYECVHDGMRCQGDNRDTIYARATFLIAEIECLPLPGLGPCNEAHNASLSDAEGDFVFAVGVNHKATGQALYSSVTGYGYPKLAPVTAGVTDSMYEESATKYLGEDDPAAKYLYVVKFARQCAADDEDVCVEVPLESDDPELIPLDVHTPMVFLERMYVNPKTGSGPAVSETILGKLVHFKPRRHIIV